MVRLTDHPDMTLDVYHGRKTTTQQQQQSIAVFYQNFTIWKKLHVTTVESDMVLNLLTAAGTLHFTKVWGEHYLEPNCSTSATSKMPLINSIR